MTEWLTIREYAALFRVHRQTVHKWRHEGLLTIMAVNHIMRVKNEPPKSPESTKQDVKDDVSRS